MPVISFDRQKLEFNLLDSSPGGNRGYLHANKVLTFEQELQRRYFLKYTLRCLSVHN